MSAPSFALPLALAAAASAQTPQLSLVPRALSRLQPTETLTWSLLGRPNDLYVLLADAPGQAVLFGRQFDLALSPSVLAVTAGLIGPAPVNGALTLATPGLPAGAPLFFQFASFDAQQGLGSLLVSNVDSIAAHDAPYALSFSFENMALWPVLMTGSYDPQQPTRLQALPAARRLVRPLPPQAWSFPYPYPFQPLHPSGSRFQMVFRAADLGGAGPERLVGVHWRPLFGAIVNETFPQFELSAALTDVVPNYSLDPQTGLPLAPDSGLDPAFAENPRPGQTPVTLCSGAYTVQGAQLSPTGYLPFPLQQGFDYDGSSSLLLETRCAPRPGLGSPLNFQSPYKVGFALQARPAATNYASAGSHGQPSPLAPASAMTGTGDVFLFDWELEFERTTSVAVSPWNIVPAPQHLYHPAIVCGFSPPGTSIAVEFRGRNGSTVSAWASSPSIANGMIELQFRVTMVANAATGAVPWVDTLIIPVQ